MEDFDSLDRLYLLVEKRAPVNLDMFILEAEKFVRHVGDLSPTISCFSV